MQGLISWLARPLHWLLGRAPATARSGAPAAAVSSPPTPSPKAEASSPAYVAQFDKAGNRIRDTAKWLVTIFAAVGALLIAGTQFSSIGSLEWGTRLQIAIAAGLVAVVATALVIWLLLDVMQLSTVTIGDLERQARRAKKPPLVMYMDRNPAELLGFDNLTQLADEYRNSLTRRRKARLAYYDLLEQGKPETDPQVVAAKSSANVAQDRRLYVQACVSYVVSLLALEQVRLKMGGARRTALFGGTLVAAVGVAAFAWAVNPVKSDSSVPPAELSQTGLADAQLTQARLTRANLQGANLVRATLVGADLAGADLTDANLRGADLRGANLEDVTWKNTICPDGTNSDTHRDGCRRRRAPN